MLMYSLSRVKLEALVGPILYSVPFEGFNGLDGLSESFGCHRKEFKAPRGQAQHVGMRAGFFNLFLRIALSPLSPFMPCTIGR